MPALYCTRRNSHTICTLALLHKLHTYTDVHGFASQSRLCGVRVLRSVAKRTAQHPGHLNIRLIRIMLYSVNSYRINEHITIIT